MDTRLFYSPATGKRYSARMLRREGLTSSSPEIALLLYSSPAYDTDLQTPVDTGEVTGPDNYGNYSVVFTFADIPLAEALARVKAPKLAAFDTIFQKLDTLKIRPAAGIAEAIAAGESIPQGDAYRLSELEAIADENRSLRDLVVAAETVDAVREVEVWWPE